MKKKRKKGKESQCREKKRRREKKKKYSIEAKTRRNVSRNAGKPRTSSAALKSRLDSRRKDVCGRG